MPKNKALVENSIGRLFLKFALPAVIGMLVNALYVVIDGIFLGRFVGPKALAAVTIAFPTFCLIFAIALLLGNGAAAIISRNLGAGERGNAKKTLKVALTWMVLIPIPLALLGFLYLEPTMTVFGGQGEVLTLAMEYSFILLVTSGVQIISIGLNPIVRATGSPKLAMNMMIIGAIINIVFDWLFVVVLGYGVKGAAIATVIGEALIAIAFIYYLIGIKNPLQIGLRFFALNLKRLVAIIQAGFVSFGVELSVAIVIAMQNRLLMTHGNDLDVAMFGIVGYVFTIFIQTYLGISQGIQPIIGYNYGAKRPDRAKATLHLAIKVNFIFGTLGLLALYQYSAPIVSIFTTEAAIIALTASRLLGFHASLPILGSLLALASYYQSIGHDLKANLIAMSRSFIILIPALLIMPHILGVEGIFWATPIADYSTLLLAIGILAWERKQSRNKKSNSLG